MRTLPAKIAKSDDFWNSVLRAIDSSDFENYMALVLAWCSSPFKNKHRNIDFDLTLSSSPAHVKGNSTMNPDIRKALS